MVQTCSKCSRANPEDAVYCYHDGFVRCEGVWRFAERLIFVDLVGNVSDHLGR